MEVSSCSIYKRCFYNKSVTISKRVCCEPASGRDNGLSRMLRVRRVLLSEGCNTPAYLETQRQKFVSLPCTYANAGLKTATSDACQRNNGEERPLPCIVRAVAIRLLFFPYVHDKGGWILYRRPSFPTLSGRERSSRMPPLSGGYRSAPVL